MSGNDLKVFNNQPAPAPVCGQSGQRRKFANEMIRSSDIFAISSTADLREPEAFLRQGNSDCIEMPVLFKRALIVHEWEYGSEHREEVTMLANCIKNDTPVLQISGGIEIPIPLNESVDHQ